MFIILFLKMASFLDKLKLVFNFFFQIRPYSVVPSDFDAKILTIKPNYSEIDYF